MDRLPGESLKAWKRRMSASRPSARQATRTPAQERRRINTADKWAANYERTGIDYDDAGLD